MKTNQELIESIIEKKILKNPVIIDAFYKIDRINFILPARKSEAYLDEPLLIGHNQTISQPSTVAIMLELLDPQPGEKFLDVGSGSGWTTALLAHIVGKTGEVVGMERIPELVELGSKNLRKYNMSWVSISQTKGVLGCPNKAPFDKILVSAMAEKLPEELIDQLPIGGRLVIPIKNSICVFDRRPEMHVGKTKFPGFNFVPLITD
ncbi:MAG: protein-L-isoaspartate O-methyltransferase [Candidatus Falkowbacteria bacterium]